MKTEEMISIMRDYSLGKKIEFRKRNGGVWKETNTPCWDWNNYEYRVKRIVPYKDALEFLTAQREHGPYLKLTDDLHDNSYYLMPFYVSSKVIKVPGGPSCGLPYTWLLDRCQWQDGTSCGKEESNDD